VHASEAEITTAPDVPPFITRTLPETLVVKFEAREFTAGLADGKQYKFWGYNGTVPGPMIRVRLGDTVEFHLSNHASSQFPHNIDIHAVNGPGGGAALSLVAPGEEKIFRFKTLHPGLFIYHCASPIPGIPAHIANGMYGLILVEPKHGFPRVDHEFYVFQSEFYTQNPDPSFVFNVSDAGSETSPEKEEAASFDESVDAAWADKKVTLELSLEKGQREQPDYVVFNGRQGALLGQNALQVKVGEKVRIFFGNIGPNGISSFHIIGEIFDRVYLEGAVNGIVNKNVQTTLVPSAGTTIVEFTIDVPGDYLLVDHSIFRMDKGAIGLISAIGDENPEIFEAIK
jgi:nitrite reductase (NO-forming)